MIRAENLTLIRSGRRLLDAVSVDLMPGKVNVIIGPNGAGKSTLMKVLSGEMRAEGGSVTYNDIDLLEGSFVTNLGQFKVSYNFTPLIYLQALVQYNDRIDAWSSNVRFSWLNTAGTGLFVVYNDTEGLGDLLIGPQNRSLIVKYTHQFDVLR